MIVRRHLSRAYWRNGQTMDAPAVMLRHMFIYPIKSLGGVAVTEAQVEPRGFQYDRRWMLIDAEGTCITQRQYPRLALIAVSLQPDGLEVCAPGMPPLQIPGSPANSTPVIVRIWRSVCEALLVGEHMDAWFSQYLQMPCRLVYMPDTTQRAVNPEYAVHNDIVSFADGYPFMLLGQASLDDLNQRLEVSGVPPFAEDSWKTIHIGATVFHVVKACDRCVLTTVDQSTGTFAGPEPLKTLATFRLHDNKVMFGQLLLPDALGTVRIGDLVTVIAYKGA
jgi:uncharacterized protein